MVATLPAVSRLRARAVALALSSAAPGLSCRPTLSASRAARGSGRRCRALPVGGVGLVLPGPDLHLSRIPPEDPYIGYRLSPWGSRRGIPDPPQDPGSTPTTGAPRGATVPGIPPGRAGDPPGSPGSIRGPRESWGSGRVWIDPGGSTAAARHRAGSALRRRARRGPRTRAAPASMPAAGAHARTSERRSTARRRRPCSRSHRSATWLAAAACGRSRAPATGIRSTARPAIARSAALGCTHTASRALAQQDLSGVRYRPDVAKAAIVVPLVTHGVLRKRSPRARFAVLSIEP